VRIRRSLLVSLAASVALVGTTAGTAVGAPPTRVTAVGMAGKMAPRSAMYYWITVETGRIADAGTDSNVWIRLNGTSGSSTWLELDTPDHDDFERGSVDQFRFLLSDIGSVTSVDISYDHSGNKPGWYLNGIKVESLNSVWYLSYYQWLDSAGTYSRNVD
jgi:hypothetical protein